MSEKARHFIMITVAVVLLVSFMLFVIKVKTSVQKGNDFVSDYTYRVDHNNHSDYTNEIDESTPGVLKYIDKNGREVRVYGNFSISKGEYKVLN